MRTLDEVIKAWEICDETVTANCPACPYDIDCENVPREDLRADTLYYLKMYRSDQIEWNANRKAWDLVEEELVSSRMKYIAKLKELDIGTLNEPLTWDELRTMEGKPVWIELHYKGCKPWSGWEIVDDVDDKWMTTHKDDYAREQMCEYWQAYRKERYEPDQKAH